MLIEGVDRSTVQHKKWSDKAGLTMLFPTSYVCIICANPECDLPRLSSPSQRSDCGTVVSW